VIICLLTQIFCVTSKDLFTRVNNQKDIESQVLVENGGNITLRCHSPRPWFFCVWESPVGVRVCGLRDRVGADDGAAHQSLCAGDHRLEISGNSTLCEVTISGVETSDHGDWTCAISDNLSLDTVKQVVSVGVSVPGDLSLSPGLPVVTLAEGDTAQFVCRLDNVWPIPQLTWSIDSGDMSTMSDMSQLWVESHEDSHLISASQSVTYTARVRDTGANISCSVSRENQDLCSGTTKSSKCNVVNQALKVMTQQKSVSLQILSTTALKNSRNGRNNPLVDKVGLASLIFVSLLAVILILVMVTMLGLRRRCGKQEVYKPVYSCPGESGHTVQSDLMYQNQPLNISYIDLYGHCNATKGDNHKPVVSVTKYVGDTTHDSSSGLGSSSVSFNETSSDCGDSKSVRTYKETHFDTLVPPSYGHHDKCPGAGPGTVHAVQTLPYTLFHCQHSCFNHNHHHQNCK